MPDALIPAPQEDDAPKSVVQVSSEVVARQERIVSFRNRAMLLDYEPYPHYRPLNRELFDKIAYPLLGGVTRSRIADVFSYVCNTAEDLTANDHYILFGLTTADAEGNSANPAEDAVTTIWDTRSLETVSLAAMPASQVIWRSPWAKTANPDPTKPRGPVPFILSLAGGDEGVYDDIMQSLAPLVMEKKPDGVIWWVGDGANGKSTLMDAIYRLFPNQLSSLTVKNLTDGRDTPRLNGTLANVVKESSEGRIDDTEIYKAIGTHEDFTVHKFHSQDTVTILGNIHHIFSGNSIPAFNDKGHSARRRTFIIPFNERFDSDPTFEARTFTPEFFGHLIAEMCRYAVKLRQQGYRYKWSAATLAAKAEYDVEANNAEEFATYLIGEGVVAFNSFQPLRMMYDNWCMDNGYVPLGAGNLRLAMKSRGFERMTVRVGDKYGKYYRLPHINNEALVPFSLLNPGLFTVEGFTPKEEEPQQTMELEEAPAAPAAPEPSTTTATTTKSILNGRW